MLKQTSRRVLGWTGFPLRSFAFNLLCKSLGPSKKRRVEGFTLAGTLSRAYNREGVLVLGSGTFKDLQSHGELYLANGQTTIFIGHSSSKVHYSQGEVEREEEVAGMPAGGTMNYMSSPTINPADVNMLVKYHLLVRKT